MSKQSKFIKEGNQIFYVDKIGRKWEKKCIDELFEAVTNKMKDDKTLDYYAFED
ncbi:hypothetical protein J4410_07770 [Candidatus Woesearchaeota archaeon]|nr:hypothetical protein [Candidatus Woesearchaeota archaeon]